MTQRTDDEKLALNLHRYRTWVQSIEACSAELEQLRAQAAMVSDRMQLAYLEAREEVEALIAGGMTRDEVESVAKMPTMIGDPTLILKNARTAGS